MSSIEHAERKPVTDISNPPTTEGQSRSKYNTRSSQRSAKMPETDNEQPKGLAEATGSQIGRQSKEKIESTAEKQNRKSAEKIAENNQMLQQLVQLLTLKIQADEVRQNNTRIVAEDFAKIIPEFDGHNMPVKQWFNNFEINAAAYGLDTKQKYVQARAKMTRTAKLFLEGTFVYEYAELRKLLEEEFEREFICSADIHEQLRGRKKHEDESFREYILQMKKIASLGVVDTASVVRYIVDGLNLKTDFKYKLYGCKTYKELQESYDVYERVAESGTGEKAEKQKQAFKKSWQMQANNERRQHCYNCGSVDHLRKDCKVGTKCFRCNQSGHMSRSCPNSAANVRIVQNSKRLKKIKINNVEVNCLVDTGADVSILRRHNCSKMNISGIQGSASNLRGLGNKLIRPVGCFVADVEVDGMQTLQKFVVVADRDIEYDALLGYDFISKFNFISTLGGYKFLPLLGEETFDNTNQLIQARCAPND
ncbi:uncharacterized protein LOC118741349 [Rhagoletis pomonella]|uniref:uncharacterized protein LOC118741349 n=1 Tax=Rhagoletis pomonella TaxID=28610 RepID=UPI00177B9F8E|nr:uncharacterized protein LOC118741349 [Rhagoletis pomonella]